MKCKNCGNHFDGKYCNLCGEKVLNPHDKSFFHFLEESFHFITHFEGTFFTTVRTMFSHPGKLSLDITNGIRKKYFRPFSLFLLLVVVYLLFPYVEGLNMDMKYYPVIPIFGDFARGMIHKKMEVNGLTEPELAALFHHTSSTVSKFLLLILIPLSALFFKLVFFRKKNYYYDYLVFSAEINSMYLLWAYLFIGLVAWIIPIHLSENFFSLMMHIPFLLYLILPIKHFFKIKWWQSVIWSLLFVVIYLVIFIQFIYKFLLFMLTIIQV